VGGLGAEQPTNGIDRGGDVHVEVGIWPDPLRLVHP
jgi:hypothetical protein